MITPRRVNDLIYIIDIQGDVNVFADNALMDAYTIAQTGGAQVFILNFSELGYMNSAGIGLMVTLLIRITRQKQSLLAFGLSEHYRQIFDVTRLDEAISLYDNEEQALFAAEKL